MDVFSTAIIQPDSQSWLFQAACVFPDPNPSLPGFLREPSHPELCGEPKVRQEVALKMSSLLSNSFKQESGGYHLFV